MTSNGIEYNYSLQISKHVGAFCYDGRRTGGSSMRNASKLPKENLCFELHFLKMV